MPRRHPGDELTAGLSTRLEMGGTSTYNRWGDEFLLEHISEEVVRVTHCHETGYFGLRAESAISDRPYTRTGNDYEVELAGISGRHIFRSFATPKAALDSTCAMMLGVSGTVDFVLFDAFAEEPLTQQGGLENTTMSDKAMVAVRLNDLCIIADVMSAMKHDLHNGKTKNLDMEIARIHTIVESWAQDENVLGGASCHDDHRCRACRDFPVLSGLQAARRQPDVAFTPLASEDITAKGVEQTEPLDNPPAPTDATTVPELPGKRHYIHEGSVFILESLSDSVVRVTHREQTGYFGLGENWDPSKPYRKTTAEGVIHTDGIGGSSFPFSTPDEALESLCDLMLATQRREDASRINPEERRQAARKVLVEFMDALPVPGSRHPPEVTGRMGKEIYERDILHLVEPDHDGEIVAIDVDSVRWAMAGDERAAVDRLREMDPDAVNILCERVGYLALCSFGAGSLRRPRD